MLLFSSVRKPGAVCCLSVCLPVCLSVSLSACLPVFQSAIQSACLTFSILRFVHVDMAISDHEPSISGIPQNIKWTLNEFSIFYHHTWITHGKWMFALGFCSSVICAPCQFYIFSLQLAKMV